MRATWPIVLLLLVSGCIAAPSDGPDRATKACPGAEAYWLPVGQETVPLEVDGVQRSDMLVYFPQAATPRFSGIDVPEKWKWEPQTIASAGNGSLHRLGMTAPAAGADKSGAGRGAVGPGLARPIMVNWTAGKVEGCEEKTGSNTWRTLNLGADKRVAPGDGVGVYYAGFWLNGTLFSTNMGLVDESGWPRGGWYKSGENRPLNVYVYDKDRTEMGSQWAPKVDGKPVAWAYTPTIKGFNEALKGLTTSSSRVVVVPKEDAYGANQTHALRHDTLVFYIDVVEIVDIPCPPQVTNRQTCRLPA